MSDMEDEQIAIVGTLGLFDDLFENIKQLALLGSIAPVEDEKLARITDQLNDLHSEYGDRIQVKLAIATGEPLTREDQDLSKRVRDRLVRTVQQEPDSTLGELAQQSLLELTSDETPN